MWLNNLSKVHLFTWLNRHQTFTTFVISTFWCLKKCRKRTPPSIFDWNLNVKGGVLFLHLEVRAGKSYFRVLYGSILLGAFGGVLGASLGTNMRTVRRIVVEKSIVLWNLDSWGGYRNNRLQMLIFSNFECSMLGVKFKCFQLSILGRKWNKKSRKMSKNAQFSKLSKIVS